MFALMLTAVHGSLEKSLPNERDGPRKFNFLHPREALNLKRCWSVYHRPQAPAAAPCSAWAQASLVLADYTMCLTVRVSV